MPVNKILNKKFDDPKLRNSYYRHLVMRKWTVAAAKFLDQAEALSKAVDFKNGVLLVACLSKELAYQIKLLASRIIEELNRLIGQAVVFGVYVES